MNDIVVNLPVFLVYKESYKSARKRPQTNREFGKENKKLFTGKEVQMVYKHKSACSSSFS